MNPEAGPDELTAALPPEAFHQDFLQIGSLRMHAAIEGDAGQPLIVLLHGFPEFWYSWRFQIRPLVAAGYRVVAPDMRGYNLTDKTPPYDVFTVSSDIVNLIHVLGEQQAVVVGHDWGGMIAWAIAMMHQEVVSRLIVCNLPHPQAVRRAQAQFYLPQLLKSWYIGFFQLPAIPERFCALNHYRPLLGALQGGLPAFREADAARYREAWSQPGAIPAMLGYYRALPRSFPLLLQRGQAISVPTTLIWGDPDFALDTRLAEWSKEYVEGLKLSIIPNSSHFVQLRHPAEVTRLMREFLAETP
ncbi:MAG: alpha/beta fold hydrolase [Ktedonobacterales bacterium]